MKKVLSVLLVFLLTSVAVYAIYFNYKKQEQKQLVQLIKQTDAYKSLEQMSKTADETNSTSSEVIIDFRATNAATLGIKTRKTAVGKQLSLSYQIVNYYIVMFDADSIAAIKKMRS